MASAFQKQDALKSLDVAKKALKNGDFEKAEKFAIKAAKLCKCQEVSSVKPILFLTLFGNRQIRFWKN